jgi:hypothetical protein
MRDNEKKELLNDLIKLSKLSIEIRKRFDGLCGLDIHSNEIQLSLEGYIVLFGKNGKIKDRGTEQYPFEIVSRYNGVTFFSIMSDTKCRETFGNPIKEDIIIKEGSHA